MKSSLKTLIVLAALIVPALFVALGDRPVYKIQEVRIAETAREMLASGDFIVPRYNGELRLQKPPLPYWATAASFALAGVDEVAVRLPSALFGLLSALLMWQWVRRESSPPGGSSATIASNSVLVLVASFIGLRYFRSGEADAMLLFFVIAGCYLGHGFVAGEGGTRRRILFGLALGLGFLSKGPAALAIPLLATALSALVEKRCSWQALMRDVFSAPGLALLALCAFGWYAWIWWRMPELAPHFFGRQLDETFGSGTHAKPVYWYFAHFFEFFAPWGVLIVPAAWMGWLGWRRRESPMPSLLRFAWGWLAVVLILLTATVNKQTQYALLLAPPLAIIIGHYMEAARGAFARANRVLFGLFCVGVLAAAIYVLRKSTDLPGDLLWLLLPLAPLLLQRTLRASGVSLPVLVVAALSATAFLYSQTRLSKEPHKLAAQTIVEAVARDAPLYQLKTSLNDGALSFYAGRVVAPVRAAEIPALLEKQEEIWLVAERLPELANLPPAQLVVATDELKLYRLRRPQ